MALTQRTRFCTVYYNSIPHKIPLPPVAPQDCHAFLKDQLGIGSIRNKEIQLEADNGVGLLPPNFVLLPGVYLVTLKEDPASAEPGNELKWHWRPSLSLKGFDRLGYWLPEYTLPTALKLCLKLDRAAVCDQFERRTEYEIDQQPLELAFCQYFDQKQPSVVFIIDRTLEAVIQEVQQDFLKSLHSRCLMLRVRHLAMGKEMLLRSDKLGSNVYGYIETSGIIEALAQAEYQHFITSQPPQLVLVLDLDHTIVHTPEAADRRHFASSVEEERVFDISLFDKTLPRLLCAPRSHILEFFRTIMDKYYVVYCTAGTQSYGIAVLRGLRRFMLAGACRHEGRAGNALRQWIESSTAESRMLSNNFSSNSSFKSLGMQFQMSYIPKLAERLVVILDDHPDVWQRSSDRRLVDMFPVRPQQYVTSDQSRKPWLQRFATLALRLHQLAFTQPVLERPLPDIKQDIANEQLRSCLLY